MPIRIARCTFTAEGIDECIRLSTEDLKSSGPFPWRQLTASGPSTCPGRVSDQAISQWLDVANVEEFIPGNYHSRIEP